ncbi:MAG: T9SS type A sorting domain-containing protein [bacterium]
MHKKENHLKGGINISNALEIVDSINVSNGTIASGGNITLVSTASKTARIARIVNGGVSGDVVAQRFIPGGAGKRKWRFLSSPINNGAGGIQLTEYIDDIHVTGMGGSANGFDNCTCLPSIRFYNETLNAIADSGWRNPSTINYQVNTGFAVEVFVRGSRSTPDPFLGTSVPDNTTIDYIGAINSGAITINLSYTNNGITNSDGFNLVGNPYPSQIDWMASGWTKTNIDRFFWSYNPDASNPIYGGFDPNSGLGTNGVTRFIPSGMGFFVKANNTGAQLGFTETVKSTGTPYNFFKGSSVAASKYPHIRIVAGDSLISDETILLFDSSASANKTDLSDIMKLFNPTINFYSKSKDNISLAFNQLPFPSNIKEDTINFSMFVFKDNSIRVGAYYMYLKELVDIPAWLGVDVLDRFTNIRTNIKDNPYNFNIENTTGSHGNNRLALILYHKPTGIENTTKQFGIYPNPAQNTTNISNYNNSIRSIKIFDMKSSLVKEINDVNQSIDVSDLIAEIYLIYIQTDKGTEIHKTIIQK